MNNRGSEWRKWDLHFHTPSSYDYEDKGITNQQIIDKLYENKISVVAITDHHIIDIERIRELQQLGSEKGITVLPGIEFLADARGKEPIHFIAIFSEDCNLSFIWGQLENNTNIKNIKGLNKKHNEVYCDLLDTIKLVRELGGIITIHAGKKTNNIENITNSLPHAIAQKTDIASNVDVYELGASSDKQDYINIVFPAIHKYIPMVIASDNHDIKKYTLKENCWIKADPTFEGLKQIIYEPEERVKIQEYNPELDYDKPFFSSIKFKDDEKIFSNDELYFDKSTQEIPLNSNLVTIIGGRGEGKSMLMKYISTSFEIKTIEKDDDFLKNNNIEVIYSKTIKNKEEIEPFPIKKNSKHALDFIYISQGELKNIVEKQELAEAISEMANIRKITFDRNLNEEISNKLDKLHSLKNFLDNPQNNLEELQQRENTQQQFISNITTKENKEKLEKYSEILKQINTEINKKNQLSNFKQSLIQKSNELNQNIDSLNENYGLGIPIIEVEQIFVSQLDKIHELITAIDNQLGLLNERKEAIKTEFSEFYTGDLTTLLRDVDKYQNELSIIQTQIKDVNEKKIKKENLQKEIFEGADTQKSLISKIEDEYKKQKEWILEDWNKFKNIEERESLNLQQKKLCKASYKIWILRSK
ncbi:hypothetical protein RCZ01_23050 [Capnocytophaga felis]|uniref:Polymerase/histidinol phosphatase N-terminal domain-containing protein n=1 Tax=Capnocytophaga felis TaxID=2267611 RepID=A0A5M4BBP0_9FLAO|nr:hypothetical protein [Capnocytophaga felis]GET47003.1 hypothetical protein RCZ01_23050 [Capnocytophaga felis]GET49731.1 hypothetical protein RCZ02_25620 [Capnocytophaga felis]